MTMSKYTFSHVALYLHCYVNIYIILCIFFFIFHRCPKIIMLDDVRNALASREEFDIFTNEGLGSRQQLNTTN